MKRKKIHYTKQQLAKAYFPGLSPLAAQRNLVRWIHENPDLISELEKKGYNRRQRQYTPAQLKVIFSFLGPP